MSEVILSEEEMTTETMDEVVEIPVRKNPFCVIAKAPWANGGRDVQTCSVWAANPYGEDYAVVPDEMVPAILETRGFLDELTLTEDGTEVVSFVAGEIPVTEPVEPEPEPTVWDELDAAYQEGVDSV